jgi:hypothetical protein
MPHVDPRDGQLPSEVQRDLRRHPEGQPAAVDLPQGPRPPLRECRANIAWCIRQSSQPVLDNPTAKTWADTRDIFASPG